MAKQRAYKISANYFHRAKNTKRKNDYVSLNVLFDSGLSATLVSQVAVIHLKKLYKRYDIFYAAEIFQRMEKAR